MIVETADSPATVTAGTLGARLAEPFWPAEWKWRAGLMLAVLLAGVVRSIRLMSLFPVLVDEAIYMRWAEIIQHHHTWYISLLDAKPPLSYWVFAIIRLLTPHDPLLGSRLVSVVAGTLCVVVVYRVGFLCAGETAGVITALLYSVLPYGVFYDRIAYVDSIVNLFGVSLVYAVVLAFGADELSWGRTLLAGLVFGIALFVKTTILLYGLVPVIVGLSLQSKRVGRLALHLLALYAVASLFPLWSLLAIPPGPTFSVNNVLVHHTNFFAPAAILLHYPLVAFDINARQLARYASAYIGFPALLAIPVAIAAVVLFRRYMVIVILLACVLPFSFAVATLEYFPSRYAFPHVWPLLLVIGCAAAVPVRPPQRAAGYVIVATVFAGMSVQSIRLLYKPELVLARRDAAEFLTSNPYSGSGVLDAIALLRTLSRSGPITILTDPWWGPSTDTVFAYLNEVDGTQVYEAWWLQLEGEYPLVPAGKMPVWKSQYERIPASEVDFSSIRGLYYVTDTNYHTPADVRSKSAAATLIQRFPKRGGADFIDIYRLN
jgi:hypothetical protein